MTNTKRRLHLLRDLRIYANKINTKAASLTYALEGYAEMYNQEESLATAIEEISDAIVSYIDHHEEEVVDTPVFRDELYFLLDRGIVIGDNTTASMRNAIKNRLNKKEHVEDGTILALLHMLVWTTTADNNAVSVLVTELKDNIIWNT